MTTDAEKRVKQRKQSGQSLLEFALLVPLAAGMLAVLVQVETAMSIAIVNARYARQHLHFLLFNSRYYPEHFRLPLNDGNLAQRWWVGVDDNPEPNAGEDVHPRAPIVKIGRQKGASDETFGEGIPRQNIRIKSMSFICTAPYGVRADRFFSEGNLGEGQFYSGNFNYCGR